MAFEIPVDISYFRHPKTKKLRRAVEDDKADVYPLRMWAWAAEYAKLGVFEAEAELESACDWTGERGGLVKALQEVGFLEKGKLEIHDWMEHAGRAIALYEAKKREQRRRYAVKLGALPEEWGKTTPLSSDSLPEECGKSSSHNRIGGEGIGDPEEDKRGGDTVPPPSASLVEEPLGGSAPQPPTGPLVEAMEEYARHWPNVPVEKVREAIIEAWRRGSPLDLIRKWPSRIKPLTGEDFFGYLRRLRPKSPPYVPRPARPGCEHPDVVAIQENEEKELVRCKRAGCLFEEWRPKKKEGA